MANKLNTNVTVHNPFTGESKTFGPDDDLPDWVVDSIQAGNPGAFEETAEEAQPTPGPSQTVHDDLIGGDGSEDSGEDSLMKHTQKELVALAEQEGAEGVSDSSTKAELTASIRATGYDGE